MIGHNESMLALRLPPFVTTGPIAHGSPGSCRKSHRCNGLGSPNVHHTIFRSFNLLHVAGGRKKLQTAEQGATLIKSVPNLVYLLHDNIASI